MLFLIILHLLQKNNTDSKSKNKAKNESGKIKKIDDTFVKLKDAVLENKTKSAVVAGATLATTETAHAIYKINSVKSTKGLNILIMGKPCAGKDVNSKSLMNHYDFVQCSTGEIIQNARKLGKLTPEEQKIMDNGGLLSNERVLELVKNFEKEQAKGIIWDGFPRNMEQAKDLNADLVIYLNVPDEYSNYKVLSRLVC